MLKIVFGKVRMLAILALFGAAMSVAGCCGTGCGDDCDPCAKPCDPCGDCANWDYSHGGGGKHR
jgi:hypothetical protein